MRRRHWYGLAVYWGLIVAGVVFDYKWCLVVALVLLTSKVMLAGCAHTRLVDACEESDSDGFQDLQSHRHLEDGSVTKPGGWG